MNLIRPISPSGVAPVGPTGAGRVAQSGEFKDLLIRSINEVNSMQQEADRAVERLITGEDVTPAEVLTAVQKADIAFKLMMQIRNKLVQAYQELQNIRV